MNVRLMLLVGLTSVLAVIAVSALVAPLPPAGVGGTPAGSTSAGPTPSAPVPTNLEPAPGEPFVLSADETGQVVSTELDKEARIEVHAGKPVSIQLGEDGPVEPAEPGTPAVFSIFGEAGAPTSIRIVETDREIGRVEVTRQR